MIERVNYCYFSRKSNHFHFVVGSPARDTALIALDEFALESTTDTHYAWPEKNTAPALPSDERRRGS